MDVDTIIVTREEAQQKLDEYKSISAKQRVDEDEQIKQLYKAVAQGARVLNLAAAFTKTGLNDLGQPKLAIARADWKAVHCFRQPYKFGTGYDSSVRSMGFSEDDRWDPFKTRQNLLLPDNTFSEIPKWPNNWQGLRSPVPHIPPKLRPTIGLHNYHILFEVEKWEAYPGDPYLLRRIQGMLFVVWAEWELTELERSLLGAIASGT